jgi:hypothetical protein
VRLERGKPLVEHQHQEVDFVQVLGAIRIESARSVLDGVGAVEGSRAPGAERHPRHGLGRQAFDGIAVKPADAGSD